MSYVAVPPGLVFPYHPMYGWGLITNQTTDATGEKVAIMGRVFWEGRPAGAKTVSSAGGSITFRNSTVTFANAGTSVDVGIQDVSASAGPPAQPDGAFDVSATVVGGSGAFVGNSWNTIAMSAGSKSIAHGDMIAIVVDMTARGGTDTLVFPCSGHNTSSQGCNNPIGNTHNGTAWSGISQNSHMIAYITADDGTRGVIHTVQPATFALPSSDAWNDTSSPDERGMVFQVPFDCKIDSLVMRAGGVAAAADFLVTLYSDPTGTPNSLYSTTILGEQGNVSGAGLLVVTLPSEITLTKDTDYCLAVKCASATNVTVALLSLAEEGLRSLISAAGTTLARATRDGGSGAFAVDSPATALLAVGVGVSAIAEATGGGPETALMGQAVF